MTDDTAPTPETVAAWLATITGTDPATVVELRALRVSDGGSKAGSTWAGTFRGDELETMAKCALDLSGLCAGVYFTLNPLKPTKFVRQAPRMMRASTGQLAHDADVIERRWVLVDIDAVRAKGHEKESATDAEKQRTVLLAGEVRAWLASEEGGGGDGIGGWPAPVVCDSGNGTHLLYRLAEPLPVVLPVPEDDPVRRLLAGLAGKFDREGLGVVDRAVFNAARIVKCPGTVACKGVATEGRPHRRARVLEVPTCG